MIKFPFPADAGAMTVDDFDKSDEGPKRQSARCRQAGNAATRSGCDELVRLRGDDQVRSKCLRPMSEQPGSGGVVDLLRAQCFTELVFLNDDIWVARDTLSRMAICPASFVAISDDANFVDRACDPGILVSNWSCFLQRKSVW